jgi:mono/diheme cytochrome c family protein
MRYPRLFYSIGAVAIGFAAILAMVALMLLPATGTAQEPLVKKSPVMPSDPHSGKQMYTDYCAPCHGSDGKGNGPAAPAMKTAPTNLALLAKNSGGKYPAAHVAAVLSFGSERPAHGSKDMPVWGQLFQSLNWSSSTKQVEAQQRINSLNSYLEALQTK